MNMKIIQVKDRTLILIEQLVELQEKSVKETHLFLSEDEIESIKKYVPQALKDINTLVIIENEIKLIKRYKNKGYIFIYPLFL